MKKFKVRVILQVGKEPFLEETVSAVSCTAQTSGVYLFIDAHQKEVARYPIAFTIVTLAE